MIHHNDGKQCKYPKNKEKREAQTARFDSRQTPTVDFDRRLDIPAVRWKGRCQPSVTSWSALPWSNFRNGSVDMTKLANDASEQFKIWSNPNSFDLRDLLDWEASWMLFTEEMRIVVSCCTLGGISHIWRWVGSNIFQSTSSCSETFLWICSATGQTTRVWNTWARHCEQTSGDKGTC